LGWGTYVTKPAHRRDVLRIITAGEFGDLSPSRTLPKAVLGGKQFGGKNEEVFNDVSISHGKVGPFSGILFGRRLDLAVHPKNSVVIPFSAVADDEGEPPKEVGLSRSKWSGLSFALHMPLPNANTSV